MSQDFYLVCYNCGVKTHAIGHSKFMSDEPRIYNTEHTANEIARFMEAHHDHHLNVTATTWMATKDEPVTVTPDNSAGKGTRRKRQSQAEG